VRVTNREVCSVILCHREESILGLGTKPRVDRLVIVFVSLIFPAVFLHRWKNCPAKGASVDKENRQQEDRERMIERGK